MKILIRNGRVIDPSVNLDKICNILINDDVIYKIADLDDKETECEADDVIDASGCFVMPGLIDLHVHLREPGYEYKETIKTGSMAAARGGFTTVCPMPNTNPATDSPDKIKALLLKAKEDSCVNVCPIGAVTAGQQGDEITDIAGMAEAGAVAISEDGKSVMKVSVYKRAIEAAAKAGIPVFAHCEDKELAGQGALNEGKASERFGVAGISNAVEDVIAARDIVLTAETKGARLHLCHCSTKGSTILLKNAKNEGIAVTGEACPHHFSMSDEDIVCDDANFKMNPPLRSKEDVQAIKEAIRDDIIDVIATDHAPHGKDENEMPIAKAPFGIVGLETAVALTITNLLEQGYITPMQMAAKMSTNPARIIGIDRGTLQPGKAADIVIIDPNEEYVIDKNKFASKGKNTPFDKKRVKGKVKYTIVSGKILNEKIKEEIKV